MVKSWNMKELWKIAERSESLGGEQNSRELFVFLNILKGIEPKVLVEIGASQGYTAWAFCHVCDWVFSIDIDICKAKWIGNDPKYWPIYLNLDSIRESSPVILSGMIKKIVGEDFVDALFIDGNHDIVCARRDYELYTPLVRSEGIIAFHNIFDCGNKSEFEVPVLWREIKAKYNGIEIDESNHQCGIGYYIKPQECFLRVGEQVEILEDGWVCGCFCKRGERFTVKKGFGVFGEDRILCSDDGRQILICSEIERRRFKVVYSI